jgi:hypothetical protein
VCDRGSHRHLPLVAGVVPQISQCTCCMINDLAFVSGTSCAQHHVHIIMCTASESLSSDCVAQYKRSVACE